MAVKNWAWQLTHPEGELLPGETPYANQDLLIKSVKESLEAGKKQSGRSPKVLVIGAVSHLPPLGQLDECLLTRYSLDDVARVRCNWPRMSVSQNRTLFSGILKRPRRVRHPFALLRYDNMHMLMRLLQVVPLRRLSRMPISSSTAFTSPPKSPLS